MTNAQVALQIAFPSGLETHPKDLDIEGRFEYAKKLLCWLDEQDLITRRSNETVSPSTVNPTP